MKYEYHVLNTMGDNFGKELAEYGDNGWEAVCTYNNEKFLILKREYQWKLNSQLSNKGQTSDTIPRSGTSVKSEIPQE